MKELVHEMTAWVTHWAATPYGSYALFLLAFAESSFFPIPPDALLIALCLVRPESAFLFALICSVGSVLGGAFGYFIGFKGGRPLLKRWFKSKKVALVENYYHRWDVWAVGLAGFTPIPYKIFTVSAGVFALNFPRFLAASVVSRSARFFLVALVFYFFGEDIRKFVLNNFALLTAAFFVLLVLGFYLVGAAGRKAASEESPPS